MTTYWPPLSSQHRPWDDGIRWHLEQSADEGPDFAADPLQVPFVRDQHLKTANGTAEDEYIEWLLRASYRQAERKTLRSLIPQTWRLVMNAFPWGDIVLDRPPLLSVTSIEYVDQNGDDAALDGSPLEYEVDAPSGPTAGRGRIRPVSGGSWPSARTQGNAVTVTFRAGYDLVNSIASIPEDITDGRLLWIAERYKQRSLSVHALNQTDAVIRARSLWMDYRVY